MVKLSSGGASKKVKCLVLILSLLRVLPAVANEFAATNAPESLYRSIEQVRSQCLADRRMVCGKILRVLPEGLVVESGYTDLLRPPLTASWLVPGGVSAARTPNLVESSIPGSPVVGTIFLTDLPRLRGKKPKPYDYVILLAYPAGQYTYPSVGKKMGRSAVALAAKSQWRASQTTFADRRLP